MIKVLAQRFGFSASTVVFIAITVCDSAFGQTSPIDRPSLPQTSAQSGQLQILSQEHAEQLIRLAAATKAVSQPGSTPEQVVALRRVQEDINALNREIAIAVKTAPPALKNTTTSALRTTASTPVALPKSAASVSAITTQAAAGEPVSYEAWDVFKNFGKQGVTP